MDLEEKLNISSIMIKYIVNQIIIYHYQSLKFSHENHSPPSQFNLIRSLKKKLEGGKIRYRYI